MDLIATIGADGMCHIFISRVPGTTTEMFYDYMRGLLARIPQNAPRRIFMWDNLRSHFSPQLAHLIYELGHQIVSRPPYRPLQMDLLNIFLTYWKPVSVEIYTPFIPMQSFNNALEMFLIESPLLYLIGHFNIVVINYVFNIKFIFIDHFFLLVIIFIEF